MALHNGVSYLNGWLPKNVWHKPKCDSNGHDYKMGLLYHDHNNLFIGYYVSCAS
jgi:hypothetical protein